MCQPERSIQPEQHSFNIKVWVSVHLLPNRGICSKVHTLQSSLSSGRSSTQRGLSMSSSPWIRTAANTLSTHVSIMLLNNSEFCHVAKQPIGKVLHPHIYYTCIMLRLLPRSKTAHLYSFAWSPTKKGNLLFSYFTNLTRTTSESFFPGTVSTTQKVPRRTSDASTTLCRADVNQPQVKWTAITAVTQPANCRACKIFSIKPVMH